MFFVVFTYIGGTDPSLVGRALDFIRRIPVHVGNCELADRRAHLEELEHGGLALGVKVGVGGQCGERREYREGSSGWEHCSCCAGGRWLGKDRLEVGETEHLRYGPDEIL
jgi:hypothetical protein